LPRNSVAIRSCCLDDLLLRRLIVKKKKGVSKRMVCLECWLLSNQVSEKYSCFETYNPIVLERIRSTSQFAQGRLNSPSQFILETIKPPNQFVLKRLYPPIQYEYKEIIPPVSWFLLRINSRTQLARGKYNSLQSISICTRKN